MTLSDEQQDTQAVTDPTPQIDAGQQQTDNPAKFAGKYDTPEALEQGIHAAREKLGLPKIEGKALFGKDGIYADVTAAELGYKDLAALMGRQQKPADTKSEQPLDQLKVEAEPSDDPFENVQQELEAKGIDRTTQDAISQTWAKEGKLTDEQYKVLQEKGGYSKAVVNAHMAALASVAQTTVSAQQAQAAEAIDKASQAVGGDEKLQSLLKWAGTHFNQAEQADLNRRLADPTLLQSAVNQIASAYRTSIGAGNSRPLVDGTHSSQGLPVIKTFEQYQDMRSRAQQGDKQAAAAMLALDDNQFAALATSKS